MCEETRSWHDSIDEATGLRRFEICFTAVHLALSNTLIKLSKNENSTRKEMALNKWSNTLDKCRDTIIIQEQIFSPIKTTK